MRTRKQITQEYAERLTYTSYQKLSLEVLLDIRALLMEELGHEEEEETEEEEEEAAKTEEEEAAKTEEEEETEEETENL
jgi:ABC-type Zn2+ transport system substrate-binding protein/surface adhesin